MDVHLLGPGNRYRLFRRCFSRFMCVCIKSLDRTLGVGRRRTQMRICADWEDSGTQGLIFRLISLKEQDEETDRHEHKY